jgi:sugar phosphate isomerase/epimerase
MDLNNKCAVMTGRYAVCQNTLRSGDMETNIGWAAAAGATAIALEAGDVQEIGLERTRDLLAEHSMSVSSLMNGLAGVLSLGLGGAATERVDEAATLCAALGAPGVLLTTGPLDGRSVSEADRACSTWFTQMAPVAADSGVRLLLEPVHPLLRWTSYVHSLGHGAELTAGHEGTGLVLDTGHLWWDRSFASDVAALVKQIGSVQIDDVDPAGLVEYRYSRVQLGEGELPLAEMIRVIEGAGYQGLYENEVIARIPRHDRVEFMRRGGVWLAELLASVSDGHPPGR